MISYVIPTRDRPERLNRTLRALGALGPHAACGGAEVIVVDNASARRPRVPERLTSGVPVVLLERPANEGAAARNAGAHAADRASEWLVMLDDDSNPLNTGFVASLAERGPDVLAVAAQIHLAGSDPPRRESGGLPEVFVGCGVALRRGAFLRLGGYDPTFGYYAEEYDLAARMLLAGGRVAFEPTFRVEHAKDAAERDMEVILARLVRNNGWVAQRYAPGVRRRGVLREAQGRYRRIAEREGALRGYEAGLSELRRTRRAQRRTPMPDELFDRFTGLAAARGALQRAFGRSPFRTATLVDEGKNAWVVAEALRELGVRPVAGGGEVGVIATMSPGPMLDAYERRAADGAMVVMPWLEGVAAVRAPLGGVGRRAA